MNVANEHCTEAMLADLAVMGRITHLVDADGFIVYGQLWPREMTVLRLVDNLVVRYEFRLPCKKSALSERDLKAANFVRDNINGMQFSDECWHKNRTRIRAMLPASPHSPIQCLNQMANLSDGKKCLFAYKGGNYERQWLEQANIPSINLEVFGCPRFDVLITLANSNYCQISKDSSAVPHYLFDPASACQPAFPCDLHMRWYGRYPPYRPIHCPASECRVFAAWIRQRMAELATNLA